VDNPPTTASTGGTTQHHTTDPYVDCFVNATDSGIEVEHLVDALTEATLTEVEDAISHDFQLAGYANLRRSGISHSETCTAKFAGMDLGQLASVCQSELATPAEAIEAYQLGLTQPEYTRIRFGGTTHHLVCLALHAGLQLWDLKLFEEVGATSDEIAQMIEQGTDPYDYLMATTRDGDPSGLLSMAAIYMSRPRQYLTARQRGLSHDQARDFIIHNA
jgi:hypothetical protein